MNNLLYTIHTVYLTRYLNQLFRRNQMNLSNVNTKNHQVNIFGKIRLLDDIGNTLIE